VDTGLDENKTELRVFILAVALKMLANSNGLLDQHVKILWDFWGEAVRFEDSENLVSSNDLDLGNTVGVSEHNTDLRWCCSLLCELADLVDDLLWSRLEPGRRSA